MILGRRAGILQGRYFLWSLVQVMNNPSHLSAGAYVLLPSFLRISRPLDRRRRVPHPVGWTECQPSDRFPWQLRLPRRLRVDASPNLPATSISFRHTPLLAQLLLCSALAIV
jgi:hypothetical protein